MINTLIERFINLKLLFIYLPILLIMLILGYKEIKTKFYVINMAGEIVELLDPERCKFVVRKKKIKVIAKTFANANVYAVGLTLLIKLIQFILIII